MQLSFEPSIYDVYTEGRGRAQMDSLNVDIHTENKLEPTDDTLSSSYAKKLVLFWTTIPSFDRMKS